MYVCLSIYRALPWRSQRSLHAAVVPIIEPVLREAHERRVLLDEQNKLRRPIVAVANGRRLLLRSLSYHAHIGTGTGPSRDVLGGSRNRESRRRCGRVPAQMWASPGADVGDRRVPAQMWASPGADVGHRAGGTRTRSECLSAGRGASGYSCR